MQSWPMANLPWHSQATQCAKASSAVPRSTVAQTGNSFYACKDDCVTNQTNNVSASSWFSWETGWSLGRMGVKFIGSRRESHCYIKTKCIVNGPQHRGCAVDV